MKPDSKGMSWAGLQTAAKEKGAVLKAREYFFEEAEVESWVRDKKQALNGCGFGKDQRQGALAGDHHVHGHHPGDDLTNFVRPNNVLSKIVVSSFVTIEF